MLRTRVTVLRGGPSSEYDVSMTTGAVVLTALKELGYYTTDVIITKRGEWLMNGLVKPPLMALMTTDVVFIALHGTYGEDGTVQKICERLKIPFTGSNSFSSALAFNKDTTKRVLRESGIKLPKHIKIKRQEVIDIDQLITAVELTFGHRYVLKPITDGSSHRVIMANSVADLKPAILTMLESLDEFMIEERIIGTEATCGVLEKFRDEDYYTLPPIEIIPPSGHDYFSADIKYTGETTELCPGRFSYDEREKIITATRMVHNILGLTQYSRSDFIVKKGEVYFLEVNTLPGLTPNSLFPKSAEAVGLNFKGLIDHLIRTAKI